MKKCFLLMLVLGMTGWAAPWRFANEALEVTVDAATGRYQVLDKRLGQRWEQSVELPAPKPAKRLTCMDSPEQLAEQPKWTILHTMLGDARGVHGAGDCSAFFQLGWTADALHLDATIRDDVFKPAVGDADWWQADSLEFWIDKEQYAVYPEQGKARLVRRDKTAVAGVSVDAAVVRDGYRVRLVVPWSALNLSAAAKPPASFLFALGVNDADGAKGREGQIYFPAEWRHSTPETFQLFELASTAGETAEPVTAMDAYKDVRNLTDGTGIEYLWEQVGQPAVRVRSELIGQAPELRLSVTALAGEAEFKGEYPDLVGFVVPGEFAGLATADGSTGHLYPLQEEPFMRPRLSTAGDLPFIGMVDNAAGHGYGVFVDSCDDGLWVMHKLSVGDATTRVPQVRWLPTMGTFGKASRVYCFYFVADGGYVAVAKAWRARAAEKGYIVPLKEKLKHNPNVFKLMGAADIWGGNSIKFARAAKAHGIGKLLINGACPPADMAEMSRMGYLPGRYDIYTDLWEDSEIIDHRSAPLPEHAVKQANGEPMTAWATFDKSKVSLKRCTAVMLDAARRVVPADLAKYPYEARFLDVTTAEGLYECYDPAHPMTRSDKRRYSEGMCEYFGHWGEENLNLVAGGEHGKWWGAKSLHYIEGMQSGGHSFYSWPAGYLKRPKNKEHDPRTPDKPTTRFALYEKYGVGPYYRIPLWDLVFHDCIVTTWYWGDATDFLIEAAPEVTPRKDALNILYVTIPTFWINEGTWTHDRSSFLRSYFHTSKLHEAVGMEEMLSHEFISADHAVQKTVFGDGTEIVVNLADDVREVSLKGQTYQLPANGFAVDGPNIRQSMVWRDGKYCSEVLTDDFYFACQAVDPLPRMDGTNGVLSMVTINASDKNHLQVSATGDGEVVVPEAFLRRWSWRSTFVYVLNEQNERQQQIGWERRGQQMVLPQAGKYEILGRAKAKQPDFQLEWVAAEFDAVAKVVNCRFQVRNIGQTATKASLSIFVDQDGTPLATRGLWWLSRGKPREVVVAVPADTLAGQHHFVAVVQTRSGEDLLPADNTHSWQQQVPIDPAQWPVVKSIALPGTAYAAELEPVSMPISFAGVLPAGSEMSAASVRVLQCQADGSYVALPFAQFDPSLDFDGREKLDGTLSFSYDAPAHEPLVFKVIAKGAESKIRRSGGPVFVPGAEMGTGDYRGETYTAVFREGQIKDLMPGRRYGAGEDFLSSLLVSSAATGWSSEDQAVLNRVDIRRNGPACSVIAVNKTLRNGATYTKTYTLLPGRFYVDVELDKPAGGNYNRGFYTLPATYLDDKGLTVEMDGSHGDGAGIAGMNPKPQWFALRGKGWAHSCVAITPFDNISFWDGASPGLGQLGFICERLKAMRFAYFVYGDQQDFGFAERDFLRTAAERGLKTP